MFAIKEEGDASGLGLGTNSSGREMPLDSGYMLKAQPAGFADGSDVGCDREESGMTLRFLTLVT